MVSHLFPELCVFLPLFPGAEFSLLSPPAAPDPDPAPAARTCSPPPTDTEEEAEEPVEEADREELERWRKLSSAPPAAAAAAAAAAEEEEEEEELDSMCESNSKEGGSDEA